MQAWTAYTTPDDFISDDAFRQWVCAGHFMQPGQGLTNWLLNHPTLLQTAQQAADYLTATALYELPISEDDVQKITAGTWANIRARESVGQDTKGNLLKPIWDQPRRIWRIAAAAVLVSGLSVWLLNNRLSPDRRPDEPVAVQAESGAMARYGSARHGLAERGPAWIRETNRNTADRLISLSDGSTVYLKPNSTLRHPITFASDHREVELTGEAFFEVAKNAKQPFFVRTNMLTTRVVGTSFLIRAFERDRRATVQVRTGRVVVYANQTLNQPGPLTVALRADQQVTVHPTDQTLTAEPVSRPSGLAQKLNRQSFAFNDVPVSTVLDAIATTYNIPIEYDVSRFANCRITTTLSDEPLTEKLSVLAEVIGPDTRYEVDGNRIRFSGRGCL